MKILHSSDIHGKYKWLLKGEHEFDMWIDTGDFFETYGRIQSGGWELDGWGRISPQHEIGHQGRLWGWKQMARRFKEWLDGRPAVIVPGNHDFINLGIRLQQSGCPNVHVVTPDGVEVNGIRFAGFREINSIIGEWMGEIDDFSELIDKVWESDPHVLVTHSPPGGILSAPVGSEDDYGVAALASALAYRPHNIKAHFFGHEHSCGGTNIEEMGVKFFNGARNVLVHELDL